MLDMGRKGMRWLWNVGLLTLGLCVRGTAHAESDPPRSGPAELKKECVNQHERAQDLRRAAKLIEARAALLVCSQDACPSIVRTDCAEWLGQVGQSVPSVVVRARTADHDELDVRVSIDGTLVTSRLDGTAIDLNPGPHAFRFERAPFDPIEQEVLIVAGERNRVLPVTFRAPDAAVPAAEQGTKDIAPAPRGEGDRPIPPLDYVLAGVTVAGVASFAGFGLSGMAERKSLEASCSPVCSPSQIQHVRTKFIIADVSLATAVLSAAAASYVYFTRPARPSIDPPRVGATFGPALAPSRSGLVIGLRGEF
jgi:hypothetical protein